MWGTRNRRNVTSYLVDMADNVHQQGNFEFAIRLLTAYESVGTSNIHGDFQLKNQMVFERLVDKVCPQLDESIFTAAWTLGGLMTLGQAIAFALASSND